jgi:hypothetical protein
MTAYTTHYPATAVRVLECTASHAEYRPLPISTNDSIAVVIVYEHRTTMSHATQRAHASQLGDSLYNAGIPIVDL